MTRARERRRPEGVSPIALTPKVESLPTPNSPALAPVEPVSAEVAPVASHVEDAPAPVAATGPADPPVLKAPQQIREEDRKVSRTFQLRESLLREAQSAVLQTGQFEGGYSSLNALVVGALERELERLAGEFNVGARFPQHRGAFRTGRPIGA